MAGVSTRTLRYYDELGLLAPERIAENGYRIYGEAEVNKLQQILFYRELNLALEDIRKILDSKDFDVLVALQNHLTALQTKRDQLDALIANAQKTIQAMKGEVNMSDQERFTGFMKKQVTDNEQKYGQEIREKYGNEAVDRSNAKMMGMSEEKFAQLETLTAELNTTLKAAFEQGDPASELAQNTCELHKNWLCFYWDSYSKEAHMGLTQMYVDDPRFTAYYDKIAPGCATFLRDAVAIYCS